MGHRYDDLFYDYIERGARASAREILPALRAALPIASVLDVGCGRGAWLAEWAAHGVFDLLGIDGEYVAAERLAVPRGAFRAGDVARPFDLGRRFDLVQCLEVGEHLPAACARTLVENLVRHGDRVLFSAATPGQGGEAHVNERPPAYWRALFADLGYAPFDCVRPTIAGRRAVEPWYRFNTLLYVAEPARAQLPAAITAHAIAPGAPIPDFATWPWRLRCAILERLPAGAVTRLAALKHRSVVALSGLR